MEPPVQVRPGAVVMRDVVSSVVPDPDSEGAKVGVGVSWGNGFAKAKVAESRTVKSFIDTIVVAELT